MATTHPCVIRQKIQVPQFHSLFAPKSPNPENKRPNFCVSLGQSHSLATRISTRKPKQSSLIFLRNCAAVYGPESSTCEDKWDRNRHFSEIEEMESAVSLLKVNSPAVQKFDFLEVLNGTPKYLLEPQKEKLVETYFHPVNMSSGEKMKMKLAEVREEFKMSESDFGSARVQVAQLTTKIKHLSSVLHKKDKQSLRGLIAMVQRRKKLLKYMRRTDWDSYCISLSKLGLRDCFE